MSYCPRSSLPVEVLAWLACRLAHLFSRRPPGRGGTRPLSLEVRLDAVGAVLLDGLSYRRAGRMVGISKSEVGDSTALLLGEIAKLGICHPDGTFVTNLADLAQRWPGSCHEHDLLTLSGIDQVLDDTEVTTLVDRGFRGLAKARAHWHAPTGDRRTKDQRTTAERAYNRCQAGLRALVEQSIGHLATAWSLRRWRGLLYRARDVFRAAAVLVSLGRWLHRLPA